MLAVELYHPRHAFETAPSILANTFLKILLAYMF
jgi:hypothetical protein